ncbi:MAG TPA: hypothetical protein VKR55_27415 [Bradyrhizobium sp.]|uniref:hypothetical protein n=1 Tax=Bradyrhizobium sp. TaxID=376 RepID=UPI002D01284E|nr:hypothetical protein [Bradyrhizobium sp.]HLZ05867.1 hypothetical protein [Bradyrhizobium sp.]
MTDIPITSKAPPRGRITLLALLYLYIAACCVSLTHVTYYYRGYDVLSYNPAQFFPALLVAAPLGALAFVFAFARFSFGYLLGFGSYTIVFGYLFLAKSSTLDYDHRLGSISAFVSLLAFLVPALFITAPIKQRFVLSKAGLERVLALILLASLVIVVVGAFFNFRLVGIADIYTFRNQLEFPAPVRYAIGNLVSALLPFAFAGYLALGKPWKALAALVLIGLFYPVTLTKLALFTPGWLAFLWLLARYVEPRIAVVLSLLLPISIGDALLPLVAHGTLSYDHFIGYFGTINFRMIAVPSLALDLYGDFFSHHDLTYFCQIHVLKRFVSCPYSEYLSVIMSKTYDLGAVNASLFATEGVASLGLKGAPLAALACGLLTAFVNRLSQGLPPRFILVSAGALAQVMMNVPFSTSLLTNGAAALFLLWYVMPRDIDDDASTDRRRS